MVDDITRQSILEASNVNRRSVIKGTVVGLAGTAAASGTASAVELNNSYYANDPIWLHHDPDTSTSYGWRDEHTGMYTVDGPVDNDGYRWWEVKINGSPHYHKRRKAWVAEKDMSKAHFAYGSGCYFTSTHCDGRGHEGVDIGCHGDTDTRIYAAQEGWAYERTNGCYGKEIRIDHGDYWTQYAHLSATTDVDGKYVDKFDWIGKMGDTGCGSGVHLHMELRTCCCDDCEVRWEHDVKDNDGNRIEVWPKTGITQSWWPCDCCG